MFTAQCLSFYKVNHDNLLPERRITALYNFGSIPVYIFSYKYALWQSTLIKLNNITALRIHSAIF